MAHNPKLLIIDGYTREARDQLVDGGASTAADLYLKMLTRCGPKGTQCEVLFPCDVAAEGSSLPSREELTQYDGVAWTGCSLSVNDGSEQVEGQIQIFRDCFAEGIPGFGSCWAAQIAVVAAGGRVESNPNGREMGIARKISLTKAGIEHPLYTDKKPILMPLPVTMNILPCSLRVPCLCREMLGRPFRQSRSVTRPGNFGAYSTILNTICMSWHV